MTMENKKKIQVLKDELKRLEDKKINILFSKGVGTQDQMLEVTNEIIKVSKEFMDLWEKTN